MKKTTICVVLAVLCLNFCTQAQALKDTGSSSEGIQIGQQAPDVTITGLINYKDKDGKEANVAKLSDFKGKLLILDFINSKGNLPSALIIDEVPTLYVHKVENLIAVARSNKVSILLGLQELPQFQQQYGKDTAATITAVTGNVLSGSVRNKETLDWLEKLFGKNKQIGEGLSIDRNKTSTSLNEKLESLIPAGKIASLNTGEMVGLIAQDVQEHYTGQFATSAINCKVNLDRDEIEAEEAGYRELPTFYDFGDQKDQVLRQNFFRINSEVEAIVARFAQPAPESPTVTKASMNGADTH